MQARDRELHRKTAAKCFNDTWTLLDRKSRSAEQDRQMLELAHASRYHWGLVGTRKNVAVGNWQISRVYAALGQSALALAYAEACLEICKEEKLTDLLSTAYEALARGYAVGRDNKRAMHFIAKALAALKKAGLDEEDRKTFYEQIQETQNLFVRRDPPKWEPFLSPPE